MAVVFQKSKMLTDTPLTFCAGCTHGIAHRLVAEALEEIGAEGNACGVAPVGCAVFAYKFFNCDMQQAAHGRAPAVATGIKRCNPDTIVFTYQGDGDLASIGAAEIVHAAARGENITVIFINNAIYGMTGGQMAPTTLPGQRSTTTPLGRNQSHGNPINVSEMLAQLKGTAYIERVSLADAGSVLKAKKAVKKAFEYQKAGKGFTMVELLSSCPTNWKMNPIEACAFVKKELTNHYPLGVFKDIK
ncbi:MAG: thiamine pyrophosphate-dependent enzyme [Firmicutes bacterium]|nr:thiamine pyrophosphate-dependent enzyme [Bacillota bacterium]